MDAFEVERYKMMIREEIDDGLLRHDKQIEGLQVEVEHWMAKYARLSNKKGNSNYIGKLESRLSSAHEQIKSLQKTIETMTKHRDEWATEKFEIRESVKEWKECKEKLESEVTDLKQKGLKQCGELAKAQRECAQLKAKLFV